MHADVYTSADVRHREIIISDRLRDGSRWRGFIIYRRPASSKFLGTTLLEALTVIGLILREGRAVGLYIGVSERIFNWLQSALIEVVTTPPGSQTSLPCSVKSVSHPSPNWGIVCRKLNCETSYSAWRNSFPLKLFICPRRRRTSVGTFESWSIKSSGRKVMIHWATRSFRSATVHIDFIVSRSQELLESRLVRLLFAELNGEFREFRWASELNSPEDSVRFTFGGNVLCSHDFNSREALSPDG